MVTGQPIVRQERRAAPVLVSRRDQETPSGPAGRGRCLETVPTGYGSVRPVGGDGGHGFPKHTRSGNIASVDWLSVRSGGKETVDDNFAEVLTEGGWTEPLDFATPPRPVGGMRGSGGALTGSRVGDLTLVE